MSSEMITDFLNKCNMQVCQRSSQILPDPSSQLDIAMCEVIRLGEGGPQGIEPLKWERVEERKGQCSSSSFPPSPSPSLFPLIGLSSIPAVGTQDSSGFMEP